METYKQRIEQVESQRETLLARCRELQISLGEAALNLPEDAVGGVGELVNQYYQHHQEIQKISGAVEQVLQKTDRQGQIKEEIAAIRNGIKEQTAALDPKYQQIGTIAFRLFRDHPLIDTSYSGVFQPLAEVHDELRQVDLQLQQLNAGAQNRKFVERVMSQGRDMLLRNRRGSLESRLPKLYQATGRQLMGTDFVSQMDDPELSNAAAELESATSEIQKDQDRIDALERERTGLEAEIQELTDNTRLPKFRQISDSRIEAHRKDMRELLIALGQAVEASRPDELKQQLDPLSECRENVSSVDELLRRLRAGAEAQEADRNLEKLRRKQDSLEEDLARVKQQIADTKKRIQEVSQEREDLIAKRGDESELFPE